MNNNMPINKSMNTPHQPTHTHTVRKSEQDENKSPKDSSFFVKREREFNGKPTTAVTAEDEVNSFENGKYGN